VHKDTDTSVLNARNRCGPRHGRLPAARHRAIRQFAIAAPLIPNTSRLLREVSPERNIHFLIFLWGVLRVCSISSGRDDRVFAAGRKSSLAIGARSCWNLVWKQDRTGPRGAGRPSAEAWRDDKHPPMAPGFADRRTGRA